MKSIKSIVVYMLVFLMITGIFGSVETFADEDELESITVPFLSSMDKRIYTWDFPYSDDLFRKDPGDFSLDLTRASMGLTVSAFDSSGSELENQYETYLGAAGFSDIYTFGYDLETTKDTLAGVIAWKQIDDFILIAAVPRGWGYGKEWGGNLEVGDGVRHKGFENGAQILKSEINSYIEEHKLSGKKKLWLSGFSRASAVSNITAADMIESGEYEEVYAYLFGVPRTTTEPVAYPGIYNICGKYDPVPQVPLESWGFERYGSDIYTPAEEMDSNFLSLAVSASEVSFELMDDFFRNNPEVNLQIHLMIEFLGELFPTREEYTKQFQDSLMTVWQEANPDTIGVILTQAISQLEDLDSRQAYSSEVMIDYLQYIMSQHLVENQRQVNSGGWNPNQSIADNVIREHMPYTYVSWLFSDSDPSEVFYGPMTTRRLTISGDADVEIWMDGKMVEGIDKKGEIYYYEDEDVDWDAIETYEDYLEYLGSLDNVFMLRSGTDTVASLPMNKDVSVVIKTDGLENLVYYDVIWSPEKTYGSSDKIHSLLAREGEYHLDIIDNQPLPELTVVSGSIAEAIDLEFTYSPTMEMAQESGSTDHLTIEGVFVILLFTQGFIVLLLLVCLVILIVHAIRKRKRKKPYSPLFVIIPHALMILVFTLLTLFFIYNLFTIGLIGQIFAAITMFIMILLALRGLIRNRCLKNIIILAVIVAVSIVNVFVYQNSKLVSSSTIHFIIYCICIIGFTILAASTFYGKKERQELET